MKHKAKKNQERLLAQVAALRCKVRDTVLLRSVLSSGGVARLGVMRFCGVFDPEFVDELETNTPHHHLYQVLPGLWSQELLPQGRWHDAAS